MKIRSAGKTNTTRRINSVKKRKVKIDNIRRRDNLFSALLYFPGSSHFFVYERASPETCNTVSSAFHDNEVTMRCGPQSRVNPPYGPYTKYGYRNHSSRRIVRRNTVFFFFSSLSKNCVSFRFHVPGTANPAVKYKSLLKKNREKYASVFRTLDAKK